MKIRCPLPAHPDRNPSASVRGDYWRCFGCQSFGTIDWDAKKFYCNGQVVDGGWEKAFSPYGSNPPLRYNATVVQGSNTNQTAISTVNPRLATLAHTTMSRHPSGYGAELLGEKHLPLREYPHTFFAPDVIKFECSIISEHLILPPPVPSYQLRMRGGQSKYVLVGYSSVVFALRGEIKKVVVICEGAFHLLKLLCIFDFNPPFTPIAALGVGKMPRVVNALPPGTTVVCVIDAEKDVPRTLKSPVIIQDLDKLGVVRYGKDDFLRSLHRAVRGRKK